MKDGYRYFISRPTAEDGNPVPITWGDPSYFRVPEFGSELPPRGLVEFWSIPNWEGSTIQPFSFYMDDVLRSGATVREIIDEKDVPRA